MMVMSTTPKRRTTLAQVHRRTLPAQLCPYIRDKGYSVWSLIGSLRTYRGDKERVLAGYRGDLTAEELEAALAYYWAKPHGIDEKLREISGEDDDGPNVYAVYDDMPLQRNEEQPWRKYIDEHSRRSEAVIRDKGMSVWSVIEPLQGL